MISFKEFLESNMIGNQSNMQLVGNTTKQAAADVALDAVASLAGPVGSIAKSIATAVWNNRKNLANKVNDEITMKKVKDIMSSRLTSKAYSKQGNIDMVISSMIGATDESQIYLDDSEKEMIKNAIISAANSGNIPYGFAQNLVNNTLSEKINNIKRILENPKNKPKIVPIQTTESPEAA